MSDRKNGKAIRAYVTNDGRSHFAVATTSRKAAAAIITSAGWRTTVSYLTSHGMMWDRGQIKGTECIFASPGTVFRSSINSDEWRAMTPEATHD